METLKLDRKNVQGLEIKEIEKAMDEESVMGRQRAIYYRPIREGDMIVGYQPTQPLPSNPVAKENYLRKGLILELPKEVPIEERIQSLKKELDSLTGVSKGVSVSCPNCDFQAASKFGLKAHQRKHKDK